ncbi:hypothetical protein F5148DRAFT_698500 [Russula earlei]|uniref:Uncharacterized protein n=1 Tax=Russula earlei TaxID=71964 RepID=A0ACC0TVC4_9AGAM|nr:hypothetical protein F5148DRAFT_698500 [Russula earlei]
MSSPHFVLASLLAAPVVYSMAIDNLKACPTDGNICKVEYYSQIYDTTVSSLAKRQDALSPQPKAGLPAHRLLLDMWPPQVNSSCVLGREPLSSTSRLPWIGHCYCEGSWRQTQL